jgi:uncharacterized C2H2 Zn-finger protein
MNALAQIQIRCRDHEAYLQACPTCQFLRRAQQNLESLRDRRAHLFQQLKLRLAAGDLIIIDLR